jgi:flagellar basal-body rod protein FlgC
MPAPIGPALGGLRYWLRPLHIGAAGMSAQQRRLEVIAGNIANAETTRTAAGGPYKRQVVRLAPVAGGGVRVEQIVEDQSPGPLIYDPGHPDADAQGYVRYPNVDATAELVDLIVARRVFEANASVFEAAKAILRRALEI